MFKEWCLITAWLELKSCVALLVRAGHYPNPRLWVQFPQGLQRPTQNVRTVLCCKSIWIKVSAQWHIVLLLFSVVVVKAMLWHCESEYWVGSWVQAGCLGQAMLNQQSRAPGPMPALPPPAREFEGRLPDISWDAATKHETAKQNYRQQALMENRGLQPRLSCLSISWEFAQSVIQEARTPNSVMTRDVVQQSPMFRALLQI